MAKRLAIVRVSSDFVVRGISFPEGSRIVDARMAFGFEGLLEFVVEHESFGLIKDGYAIPVAKVICSAGRPSQFAL